MHYSHWHYYTPNSLEFLIKISTFPGCDKEDSVLTVRWWLHSNLRLFMIHLFRTKRSGFSSKISILSKKILIRLNVKVQNTRKCWTKIWFTHFCFSPKLKPARIKNSYLAEIVRLKMEMNDICKCMLQAIYLKTHQFPNLFSLSCS